MPRWVRPPQPDHYDDPCELGYDPRAVIPNALDTPVLIATGLSDEEDALRLIHLKFALGLGFCRNCEGTYQCEMEDGIVFTTWCPACVSRGIDEFLCIPGTKPYGSRHKR